jgi:hypothetical protein
MKARASTVTMKIFKKVSITLSAIGEGAPAESPDRFKDFWR